MSKKQRKFLGIVLIIIFLGISWFFLIKLPVIEVSKYEKSLTKNEYLTQINNRRKTVAQIIGGIVLLAGLYFTWKRVQVNEEGQITERFTRAIDQLCKKENLEVRLGGIYALERIAKDSPKDHPQIMEILVAYVRENAKIDMSESQKESKDKETKVEIKEDIQSILKVIGRRNWKNDKKDQLIDLRSTNLQQYKFDGYFKKIILSNSNLKSSNFKGAKLHNANFMAANLQQADFRDAKLHGANLGITKLSNSFLCGADIQNIQFWRSIDDFDNTNISDIINAPEGFVEFATKHGAIK